MPDGAMTWAEVAGRLAPARTYWLSTTTRSGAPHAAPVWGAVTGETLCLFSERRTVKARNLAADPRCSIATDNAYEPVIVEGDAFEVTDEEQLRYALDLENRKYDTDYGDEMIDTASNTWFRLRPDVVFSLDENDFTVDRCSSIFHPPRSQAACNSF